MAFQGGREGVDFPGASGCSPVSRGHCPQKGLPGTSPPPPCSAAPSKPQDAPKLEVAAPPQRGLLAQRAQALLCCVSKPALFTTQHNVLYSMALLEMNNISILKAQGEPRSSFWGRAGPGLLGRRRTAPSRGLVGQGQDTHTGALLSRQEMARAWAAPSCLRMASPTAGLGLRLALLDAP